MSKKSTSSKPKKPKFKFPKKLLFLLVLALGFLIYKPELIPHPRYQEMAFTARNQVAALTAMAPTSKSSKVETSLSFSRLKSILPEGEVLGQEDVYVEENLSQLYRLLQNLPQERLNQLQTDFCQDLVDRALEQATTSSSGR